jgi:superfamily II helicase
MTNIEMHVFIKKLVEAGTEDRFTLLAGKKFLLEPKTIHNLMEEAVFVKNNTCKHSFKITLDAFIKSNKSCKTCLSTKMCAITDRNTVINNSQHNTQAI